MQRKLLGYFIYIKYMHAQDSQGKYHNLGRGSYLQKDLGS